jgi:predicted RNA-binding Zn-ribbon protein involved in translation (DUF1610 family)
MDHTLHSASPLPKSWPVCPACALRLHYPEASPPSECPDCGDLFPLRCSKCKGRGHKGTDCVAPQCYRCSEYGHIGQNCRAPRCYLCGIIGHKLRHCPQQLRSRQTAVLPGLQASSQTAGNWDTATLIGDSGHGHLNGHLNPDPPVMPHPAQRIGPGPNTRAPQTYQQQRRIRCTYCKKEGDECRMACIPRRMPTWVGIGTGTHLEVVIYVQHDLVYF